MKESVNGRRGFIKGFGVLSVLFAGSAVANKSANAAVLDSAVVPVGDSSASCEAIDHLAPSGRNNLTIISDNAPPAPPVAYGSGDANVDMRFHPKGAGQLMMCVGGIPAPSRSEQNAVSLSVGKDNRLWAKIDGQWRRVALEG